MTSSTSISGSLPSLPMTSSLDASIAKNSISNGLNALEIVTSSVETVFASSTTSNGSISNKITVTPDEVRQWIELSKKIELFLSQFLNTYTHEKRASSMEKEQKDPETSNRAPEADWRAERNELLNSLRPESEEVQNDNQTRSEFLNRLKLKVEAEASEDYFDRVQEDNQTRSELLNRLKSKVEAEASEDYFDKI